jgi:hypothetical protein
MKEIISSDGSGTIDYTSVSNELLTGVPLADQLNRVPFAIVVELFDSASIQQERSKRLPYAGIRYTNKCGSGQIEFNAVGLGIVSFVSITSCVNIISTALSTCLHAHHKHIVCLTDKSTLLCASGDS